MEGSDFMKKRIVTLAALFTAGVLSAVTPVLAAEGTDTNNQARATEEAEETIDPPLTEWISTEPSWKEIEGEKYLYLGYQTLEDGTFQYIFCPNTWCQEMLVEEGHRVFWFYSDENGKRLKNSWVFYNNQWYRLLEDGRMATGWAFVDNHWYYFNNNGDMVTGWKSVNKKWYYLNENGDMATGWKFVNGSWYYLNENGDMATGWIFVNGKWYFLNENGDMATGWILLDGTWYYLNENGDMATGWIFLDGDWYYLKDSGAMACRETLRIDGTRYSFNRSGVWYK